MICSIIYKNGQCFYQFNPFWFNKLEAYKFINGHRKNYKKKSYEWSLV